MKFIPQVIPDIILIEPTLHGDDRGYFLETFRQDLFNKAIGRDINFIQDNESKSSQGVLRGLHYQVAPFSQSKLLRVIEGAVLDVVVDIRKSSPTFGQHLAMELTADNKRQLFVPQGFAHGFVVLSDSATFTYKVDSYYAPEYERGIAFNDQDLKINWQLKSELLKLSNKDLNNPKLLNVQDFFD
ncbi:MAG: dTDP-4-dehydrorhamnose 3,5-epimerase [Candidatus Pseudothioglobus sp.]